MAKYKNLYQCLQIEYLLNKFLKEDSNKKNVFNYFRKITNKLSPLEVDIALDLLSKKLSTEKEILKSLQNQEISLTSQIKDLGFKNSLLSDNLDLDYIETLIRERFLFGKKNETIYILKNNGQKN